MPEIILKVQTVPNCPCIQNLRTVPPHPTNLSAEGSLFVASISIEVKKEDAIVHENQPVCSGGVCSFLAYDDMVLIGAHRLLAAAGPPAPQPPEHAPTPPPAHESINAQSSAEIMAGGGYRTCPPTSRCHGHAPSPGCCNYQQRNEEKQ